MLCFRHEHTPPTCKHHSLRRRSFHSLKDLAILSASLKTQSSICLPSPGNDCYLDTSHMSTPRESGGIPSPAKSHIGVWHRMSSPYTTPCREKEGCCGVWRIDGYIGSRAETASTSYLVDITDIHSFSARRNNVRGYISNVFSDSVFIFS